MPACRGDTQLRPRSDVRTEMLLKERQNQFTSQEDSPHLIWAASEKGARNPAGPTILVSDQSKLDPVPAPRRPSPRKSPTVATHSRLAMPLHDAVIQTGSCMHAALAISGVHVGCLEKKFRRAYV